MSSIKTFFLWFLDELPNFLWSEPLRYFVALLFGAFVFRFVIALVRR